MSYSTVVPIWNALRQRFTKMANGLSEQELDLHHGQSSIRSLLQHTAEVEYMFAEWFFEKQKPAQLPPSTTLHELRALLESSNKHLQEAMEEVTEEQWQTTVESPMGPSTPLEAIGRLMYHAGIHSGQIALIRKQ